MHHLERSTEDGSSQVGLCLEDGTGETSGPLTEPGSGRHQGSFVFSVGDNFSEFGLDVGRVDGLTSESRENASGLVELSLLDEVSGRVGQEEETTTEAEMYGSGEFAKNGCARNLHQTPSELDGNGDSVLTGILSVLGEVDDDGGQHQTDGDAELVTGYQGSSDLSGTDLTHIKDNNCGNEAHSDTGDDSTDDNESETVGGEHLNDDTGKIDGTTSDNGDSSTDHVGKITSDEGTCCV